MTATRTFHVATGRPLGDDELHRVDAYWRAANHLSVGQIYLMGNPLLREPLQPEQVKPRLLGHWGTTPGLNLLYAHLSRIIAARSREVIYVTGPGHGDRELYLPKSWADDRARFRRAHIGDEVEFATKPEQAKSMLERAVEARVPFAWFTGDEAYGQNRALREWCEDQDIAYVLATRKGHEVASGLHTSTRVDELIAKVRAGAWRRMSCGDGAHPRPRSGKGGTVGDGDQDSLIPMTVKEIRHLIAILILAAQNTTRHALTWSNFRRRCNQRARTAHYRKRLSTLGSYEPP